MFRVGTEKRIDELKKVLRDNHKELQESHKDIDYRLDNLEKVALAHDINLQEHMKRSESNEKLIKHVEEQHQVTDKKLNAHIAKVEGALKLIGVIATLAAIFRTIN